MKLNRLIAILMLLCSVTAAYAQSAVLKIAGGNGGKTSTYSQMLVDFIATCGTEDQPLQEQTSTGGPENLELLRTNKIPLALIPSDLLAAAKLQNPGSVSNIRILFTLHQEAVHLVVRSDVKTEGGHSFMGKTWGGTDVIYKQAEDLKGRPVGAVGGSAMSARILSDLLHEGWVVQEFKSNDALIAALTNHQVDAAVFVAGAPSPAISLIKGDFKLLSVHGTSDTAKIYKPTKVQYLNLNNGQPVDTLSEQAVMATRVWSSDAMVAKMAALRACFVKKLPDIKDASGTHAAWQEVNSADQGLEGFWYELPRAAAETTPLSPPLVNHNKPKK